MRRSREEIESRIAEFAQLLDDDMKREGYPVFMSSEQVAEVLGRSQRTVRRMAERGLLVAMGVTEESGRRGVASFRRYDVALLRATQAERYLS